MLKHSETPRLATESPGEVPGSGEANVGADWDVVVEVSWESFSASDPPARIYRGRNENPPAARPK